MTKQFVILLEIFQFVNDKIFDPEDASVCTALDLDFIITFLSSINFSWPGQFSVYKLYVLSLLSHFTIEQIDTWLSFGLFIL